ncbi:MAG: elongation factor 1-beta [Thermoprotei archaeon]|nr:MAG: elongation factor 1-beta [Thermoprotei archaeon]
MAKVVVSLKILPEDIDTSLDELEKRIKENLPENYEILKSVKEPIAFGLYALKLYVSIPEETAGGTSKLEEIISGIEGVSQVEVLMVSRMFT